jgi:hypothetical protein
MGRKQQSPSNSARATRVLMPDEASPYILFAPCGPTRNGTSNLRTMRRKAKMLGDPHILALSQPARR